ncbi:Protein kinase C [Mycena indigotica]|uniref:protein kinase C n=1 Tax=Mycena indigotica TaxID=2126181 RepID=A0A8H6SID5_9AGAR|nr:Protein kinase C [Mycena indigotica]KAF7299216.1 Protein kinase C [Mycena indigotica]
MDELDQKIQDVYKHIATERKILEASQLLRQATTNPDVLRRNDSKIRETERSLAYFEQTLRELLARKNNPQPDYDAPQVPPKGGRGPMPGGQGPSPSQKYSNLDLIKAETPHTPEKISRMLHQLEFKLRVEQQYKEGIEKMAKLYSADGDKRSRTDADQKKIESEKKIQLLNTALKRYKNLHVLDVVDEEDATANVPGIDGERKDNLRAKPLSGTLHVTVHGAREIEHAPVITGRSKSSSKQQIETVVSLKVEGTQLARSHPSRTDRWNEDFTISVDKANEVEIVLTDKHVGDTQGVPIGLLWIRISDLVEALRRQKVGMDSGQGWVTAGAMPGQPASNGGDFNAPLGYRDGGTGQLLGMAPTAEGIDAWFAVEPAGAILLHLNFIKENVRKRPLDAPLGGLGRQGAVRKRKDEVHEMNGHKFVQRQFYQLMLCAFCSEFLLNAAGYQCEDCRYTCHKKCYEKVVTKCISKSNTGEGDEEKINHRIPHRFEPLTNMGANWCCHCGYMLPFGRKNSRKCSECNITCHANCAHLVPDFCGMSMETANRILRGLRDIRSTQSQNAPRKQLTPGDSPTTGMANLRLTGSDMAPPPEYGRPPPPPAQYDPIVATSTPEAPHYYQHALPGHVQPPAQSPYAPPGPRPPTGPAGPRPGYDQPPPPQPRPPPGAYDPSAAALGPDGYPLSYPGPPRSPQPGAGPPGPRKQGSQGLPMSPIAPRPPSMQPPQSRLPPPPQQQQVPVQAPVRQQTRPKRKVGLDDFNFLAVLGKGNFGKVMLAEEKKTNGLYAIKVLKKEFIIDNDEVESTRSEKRVFLAAARERHPFLLGLHSCFQTETRVYFVMEYAKFYASEVLLALEYFHKNGIIYRDLKLDNILLTLDGHVKVADYGLCKEEMWYGKTTSTFCGTPEFMAPEILLEQRYGRAVDWWAFGVLTYEMLLGQSPFRGDDEDEIFDAILEDEPLYPITMPRDAVSILQKLLNRDPQRRLGAGEEDAEEIKRQPFFKDVNWDDVLHKRIPPPYFPTINGSADTSNFDEEFTKEQPTLTPVHGQLSSRDQQEFAGFSWVATWADV